jgi:hypothetical protein
LVKLGVLYVIYKLKLDKRNTKNADLAQQNGFGPAFWHSFANGITQQNSC